MKRQSSLSNILFYNEDIDFQLLYPSRTIDWLKAVAATESFQLDTLCYIFCSDQYLLKINQDHLEHDYFTDIITFPYNHDPIVADLFISIDRVRENAQSFEVDFDQEIHRVMVHGLLHLFGFDDQNDSAKLLMRQKENEYLLILPTAQQAIHEEE